MKRTFLAIGMIFVLQACICNYSEILNFLLRTPENSSSSNQSSDSTNTTNSTNSGSSSNSNNTSRGNNNLLDCRQLVLTSPQGLPQGDVTFYWNTVANAQSYQINIYSGNIQLATWETSAPNTNLTANVSSGAIQGQNPLKIELIVEAANGEQCSKIYEMDREALRPARPIASATRRSIGSGATATPSNTPTDTATFTATFTPTDTATFTATFTPTDTPTNAATVMPTDTPTNTATPTPTDTATSTATPS